MCSPSPVRSLRTERGTDRVHGGEPARKIGDGNRGSDGIAAVGREGAGPRLIVEIVTGRSRQRTGLAHPRHRAVDDVGMHRAYVVVTHAEAGGYTRAEAFDHDVGVGRERERALAAFRGLQVEHDAALVDVERFEQRGVRAHRIAPRALDLDDVGAELAEQLRCVRTGSPHRQIENAYTLQETPVRHVSV